MGPASLLLSVQGAAGHRHSVASCDIFVLAGQVHWLEAGPDDSASYCGPLNNVGFKGTKLSAVENLCKTFDFPKTQYGVSKSRFLLVHVGNNTIINK